jgi:hypothetical protein
MDWLLLGKIALGLGWGGFVIWLVHRVIAQRLPGDPQ